MNLSVQRWWKDKMAGLQNIKCIPLGHTSWFHPFIMMPEISCETRFCLSREHSIYFYKRWTFFSFYIIIKTTLPRNCFEYANTVTKDWFCFESGLDCQSPKQIFIFLDINLKAMRWKIFSNKIGYRRVFGKTGNSKWCK